ncbi:MAG: hypothetical protein PHI96_07685, partial [Desulfovibrio sp.]|nr:hypothetical protein [Desulfovibrio sp.]
HCHHAGLFEALQADPFLSIHTFSSSYGFRVGGIGYTITLSRYRPLFVSPGKVRMRSIFWQQAMR